MQHSYYPAHYQETILPQTVPVIDGEFDQFELNSAMKLQLHEVEVSHFYHDTFEEESWV